MLNILVCVKQVPDINLVKMDPVTGSLIRAGVPAILNPLDANALEAAVRVKEAHGGTVSPSSKIRVRKSVIPYFFIRASSHSGSRMQPVSAALQKRSQTPQIAKK